MFLKVIIGIMIPFVGTLVGSSVIFIINRQVSAYVKNVLSALAGGIMMAASVWSLILPALELSEENIFQIVSGFLSGIISMIWADRIVGKTLNGYDKYIPYAKKTLMQLIAVTVHNIPEGMAVGMVFASLISQGETNDFTSAFLLSFGIAMQNIPEGAIVTMPVMAENKSKKKTAIWGFVSGIVEPFGALIAIITSKFMAVALPFFLSFAAGAMVYVVTEQLIPDMYDKEKRKGSITFIFSLGFLLMMSLDIIFG